MECGTLTVPEDYARPHGKTIELSVARVASASEEPAKDPLVYLSGGPGSGGIVEGFYLLGSLYPTLKTRDVILIDQRGTGFSKPALDCPEVSGISDEDSGLRALAACRKRWTERGVDLAQYRSENSARDLRALREALHIRTWNPLGTSYGTRLALELMRVDPEGTRTAILDSTLPPDVDNLAETPAALEESIEAVFRDCAAAPACRERYPELEARFFALLGRLDDSPLRVELEHRTLVLSGTSFARLVHALLYDVKAAAFLPALVNALERGDLTLLLFMFGGGENTVDGTAVAMYLSVICAEWTPMTDARELAARTARVHPSLVAALDVEGLLRACEVWNVPVVQSAQFDPVISQIPALVLAGAIDPATPPRWGEHATRTLAHSHFSLFKGQSHGVILSECGAEFAAAFIAEPGAVKDPSCDARDLPLFAQERAEQDKSRARALLTLRHRPALPWLY
jgi:pimeloyl-ACP methyl ester carboxylesterase